MANEPIEYRINTVEFVRAEVSSKIRTGAQLVLLPIEIAIVAKGVTVPTAGAWAAGVWEAGPGANKAIARRVFTFTTAGQFWVYTRHTDAPETSIKFAGAVMVK